MAKTPEEEEKMLAEVCDFFCNKGWAPCEAVPVLKNILKAFEIGTSLGEIARERPSKRPPRHPYHDKPGKN